MEHPYLKYYEIKENSRILDLGATQGDFATEILPQLRATNSILYCVEPEPYNLSKLSDFWFTEGREHMSVISGMSGKITGFGLLETTDQALLHHSVDVEKQKWGYINKGNLITPTYNLDALLKICGGSIDFIKCDIEGGEINTFLYHTNYECIRSLAVASYHIVNGERTWKKLVPFFKKQGYHVETDLYPEYDDRDMVYAWR